jgi:hypothetical protein
MLAPVVKKRKDQAVLIVAVLRDMSRDQLSRLAEPTDAHVPIATAPREARGLRPVRALSTQRVRGRGPRELFGKPQAGIGDHGQSLGLTPLGKKPSRPHRSATPAGWPARRTLAPGTQRRLPRLGSPLVVGVFPGLGGPLLSRLQMLCPRLSHRSIVVLDPREFRVNRIGCGIEAFGGADQADQEA